jgi:hypothetical protein
MAAGVASENARTAVAAPPGADIIFAGTRFALANSGLADTGFEWLAEECSKP